MAQARGKIYLGYEDEIISDKNQATVNYTVNKIGGVPAWPPLNKVHFQTRCPLCGLPRFLLLQCYAPLENSTYHRLLYIFACVNPNCWHQTESWACIRSQTQASTQETRAAVVIPPESTVTWCEGADDWDQNDNGDSANGNVMNNENLFPNCDIQGPSDDEESNSLEMETVEEAFGNLQVFDAHNANANMAPVQGAVGANAPPVAAAELEGGDEPDIVCVDTPTRCNMDLHAMMTEKVELAVELRNRLMLGAQLEFVPKYVYVEEEVRQPEKHDKDNVLELINKYKRENDLDLLPPEAGGAAGGDEEAYESAKPLHGDALFHAFVCRLRENPSQILREKAPQAVMTTAAGNLIREFQQSALMALPLLTVRYSRDEPPILGAPLSANPGSPNSPNLPGICERCGSKLICELQLLPAFTNALQLPDRLTIHLRHLQFLSVLIFTCSQSCWSPDDSLVMETVIFQAEI